MIAWVSSFAFLAVALAAPQLQTLPLGSQIISGQPATRIVSNVQGIPAYNNIQTLGLRNVQALPAYNNLPLNVQSYPLNTLNYQQVPVNTLNYQQVPVNTLNYQQYQPQLQTIRYNQPIRPLVSTAQPILKSTVAPYIQPQAVIKTVEPLAQPIIKSTIAPLTVQQTLQQRLVPHPQYQGAAILRQIQEVQADGTYSYAYETENGIKSQEEGRVLNQGTDQEANVVQGSYSYTSPDGTPITVNYIADENGFRAEGEHIPKPSEAILRSLEYLRSLPPRPEDESGKYVPNRY